MYVATDTDFSSKNIYLLKWVKLVLKLKELRFDKYRQTTNEERRKNYKKRVEITVLGICSNQVAIVAGGYTL